MQTHSNPPRATPDKDAIALLPPFERLGLDRITLVTDGAGAREALARLKAFPSARLVLAGKAEKPGAVDALLAGRPVPAVQQPSIGCNIKWKPGNAPEYF